MFASNLQMYNIVMLLNDFLTRYSLNSFLCLFLRFEHLEISSFQTRNYARGGGGREVNVSRLPYLLCCLPYLFVNCFPRFYSACRRRGGVLKCPRFWVFFSVSKVGAALMGDTAGSSCLSRPKHGV